jgi:hypothetical protein
VFFKAGSLGFEKRVSDAVSVVPVQHKKVTGGEGSTTTKEKENDREWEEEEARKVDPVHPPSSTIKSSQSTLPTSSVRRPVNLFDDDDVDDLFATTTTTVARPVVSQPSHVVIPPVNHPTFTKTASEGEGEGEGEGHNAIPGLRRAPSNVFDNDGFSGF